MYGQAKHVPFSVPADRIYLFMKLLVVSMCLMRKNHRFRSSFFFQASVFWVPFLFGFFATENSLAIQSEETANASDPLQILDASGSEIVDNVLVTLIQDISVSIRESGFVDSIDVKEGDFVEKKGELAKLDRLLHEIDQKIAAADHEIAKSKSENDVDLRYAIKSSAYASTVYEKTRQANARIGRTYGVLELKKSRLDAEREQLKIDQAKRDIQVAKLETELKSRQLEAANARVAYRTLTSPVSGQVVEIFVQPGEWVNSGEPIMRIIGLKRMRVMATVDGNRFDRSLLGKAVELLVDTPPSGQATSFPGKITFVSPEMDPSTGHIRIWAEVENTELRLRSGARGRLKILTR